MIVHERSSPNHNNRPVGVKPDLLIIHGTAGKTDAGDVTWCCTAEAKVSYHYIVGRDGAVYRLVPEGKRAWHAGQSSWQGRPDCNSFSIGVGLSNDGKEPFTDTQYVALARLALEIMRRWRIPPARIVGHCHVSPGRKTDPWLHFEWGAFYDRLLALAGVQLERPA